MADSNLDDAMDTPAGTEEENSKDKSNIDFEDLTESKQKRYAESSLLGKHIYDSVKKEVSEETFRMQAASVPLTSQDQTPKTKVSTRQSETV